jgi:ribonuclease D
MYASPTFSFDWIRTPEELVRAADSLESEPVISVDTETSGWQTGNEQLCLIQIGIPTKKHVLLVDVLSAGAPTPLGPLLASPDQIFIAHNAAFEERQFARYDLKVKGIRDTLHMSREFRPDLPNHTLRTCCRLLLGVELRKDEQTSDWSARPLSDSQIDYARLDAEVALSLYDYLAGLEARCMAELHLAVPELMREYTAVMRQRFEASYDGPDGRCLIQKVKRTEVNVQRVREMYPEFADEVVQEYVDRKRFDTVAKERGLPKNSIEKVLDTVGYNERLVLSLKDDVGREE